MTCLHTTRHEHSRLGFYYESDGMTVHQCDGAHGSTKIFPWAVPGAGNMQGTQAAMTRRRTASVSWQLRIHT
jgi:hypothetical protein